MKKYEIKNLSTGNEIHFFGDVGYEISARQVMEDLTPLKGQPLRVLINSPGGNFFEGVTLFNWLRENFPNLETEVLGYAASAASIIFLAGKTRIMNTASFLMIHSVSVWMSGTAEDLRKEADVLEKLNESLIQIYVQNSNMSEELVRECLKEDTWFSADEAVLNGLATSAKEDAPEVAAHFDKEKLAKMKNVPEGIKNQLTNLIENTGTGNQAETGDKTNMTQEEIAAAKAAADAAANKAAEASASAGKPDTTGEPQNATELAAQRAGFQNAAQMADVAAASGGYKAPGEKNYDNVKTREVLNVITTSGFTPSMTLEFMAILNRRNPMRDISRVITYEGSGKIQVSSGVTGAWGAEGATPSDGTPTYTPITLDAFNLNGYAKITDDALEQNWGNVKQSIYDDIAAYVANQEATAMFGTGAGSDRPQGIFNATATTTTAANTGFTADELVAFLDGLPTGLENKVALMHPSVLTKIAALVDTSKKIDLDRAGQKINGIPYVSDDRCPSYATNTNVIVAGDLKRGYAIGSRTFQGSAVKTKLVPSQTEMVTNILFNFKSDGRIVDSSAFKVLKIKV